MDLPGGSGIFGDSVGLFTPVGPLPGLIGGTLSLAARAASATNRREMRKEMERILQSKFTGISFGSGGMKFLNR